MDELADAFDDDTERELFLADVASFRRGEKGLVEYKNELLRRIKLYQPNLSTVPTEFQRQAVTRFIEGLDDVILKRKLRRYGGPGYVNNTVQPTQFRMQGPQMNIAVRPPTSMVSTATTPTSSMATFGALGSSSVAPSSEPIFAAAAAAASPDVDAAHQRQQEQFDAHAASSWWSPGMFDGDSMAAASASGYDESLGTYAYGSRDF